MIDPTVGTEVSLNIDSIKEIMDGIDPEAMLPQMSAIFSKILIICRIAVMAGPIILLVLGLVYLFLTPKEANYYLGYRCYFGMGSTQAWQFTQRIAGILFTGVGLILTIVMFLISAGFGRMEMMSMVWKSLWCLVLQAVLVLILTFFINGMVMFWFNRNGEVRRKAVRKKTKKAEK